MTTKTHEIKLDGYGAHTTLAEDRPIMLLGTAESYGIETLHVVFGKSWEGLTVTATFNAPDGTSTDVIMGTDGNIAVPTEATAKSGSGRIVFAGVSNGVQRISCDLEYFVVAHSAINGTQSGGIAPSWFEQAVTRFMPTGGTAGQVLTKLTDTDFDAEWQDSQGSAGLEPLVGTNKTLTPGQVREAFLKGQPIVFSFIAASGEVAAIFQSFELCDDIIVASSIIPLIDSQDMGVGVLTGYLSSNVWEFSETLIKNPDEIQAAINTALAQAKASGEFDGADGKSAYSYAQDGGYTGTEAEFAAKLAAESIDKALFVVNIKPNSGGTPSADKTFEEIINVYNEGKYDIVAAVWSSYVFIMPLLTIAESSGALFSVTFDNAIIRITITSDNKILMQVTPLATATSKLPNPYPLTFTGAVNETYDGSSAKTIEIPSGGGGAHSDWNQNDSTAADYIKNRPFYMGDPVETVLVEERTVSFADGGGGRYAAEFESTFEATVGETYKVSWDGTVYECNCVEFSGNLFIGNLSIIRAGADTGEPFVMGIVNGVGISIITADTSASHTFSISRFTQEVVKIDTKYLPEAAFRVRNLDTTKSYSTEEIEEIYKSAHSGSVVYYLNGSIVTKLLYTANKSLTCVLSDRSSISISPIDNVWDFSNPKTKYPSTIDFASRYYSYANIATGFTNVVGGIDASGYELIGTNLAGFIGNYIQADNAIVLKLQSTPYYLFVSANTNGEIEVTKRADGSVSGGDTTTLFKNGDDSMILKSSTEGSTKKFKITVDDSGTITATEIVAES